MRALRKTLYHEVLGRSFLHRTADAAEFLNDFHRKTSKEFKVAAIYCEMNGFTINPDRWYFDVFAYKSAGDRFDLEWLAKWDADYGGFQLTGMEPVQAAFELLNVDEDLQLSVQMAGELADHLVNARFMQLIAAAHNAAKKRRRAFIGLPVLATAHDWDTVHWTE